MNKFYLLIFILTIMVTGCQRNNLRQQLTDIDSLSMRGNDSIALEALNSIVPEIIEDEECLAYYWLLKIRTEIRLQTEIDNLTPIDISIAYYKKVKDIGKLARAYGYKGYQLGKQGDLRQAVKCLKEAESILEDKANELELANRIYSTLAYLNHTAKENQLELEYSRRSLRTAYLVGHQYDIVHSLMSMYVAYRNIGNNDSASFYMEKCIPLLDSIPLNEQSAFCANIGNYYVESDTAKSVYYLTKSLDLRPNAYAYNGLASIYYRRRDMNRAQEFWQKALQTDNLYLKAEILQAQSECQKDMGDYQSACATIQRMAEVKDSILQKQHEEDIRGMQQRFDQERSAIREHRRLMLTIWSICALLFLSVASCLYLYRRYLVGNRQLRAISRQLDRYRSRLKVLQDEGKTDTREVERLTQKIAELQKRQNAQLENGRRLMEEIEAGGNTVRWHRNDFADCIEYYRTVDPSFVAHMETDFDHLSAKYIFFSIIENQGYDMEQLQRIMAVSQSTVRSIRSRINNSLIHENNR